MSTKNNSVITSNLKNQPFEYRKSLTLPKNINFGFELEMEGVNPERVLKLIKNLEGNWKIKEDKSLEAFNSAEIVSPVLKNTKETWIIIKKLGILLKKLNPNYENSSFQVNFDGSLLPTIEDRVRFLKLYAMYEDIIYRFSKGEDENYRQSLEIYAGPIILTLKGLMNLDSQSIIEMFSNNKRYGIIFKNNNQDLIEFRTPNSTSNMILIQNYITTFYYLLEYVKNNKYNKKLVDEYINNYMKTYILESYERCNEEKAIEFATEIFPSQIDRTMFLHQYLRK